MEWLLSHAKEFSDIIGLGAIIATGGAWISRRVVLSIKRLDSILKSQVTLTQEVANISSQLRPNGGESLFDMVKDSKKKTAENGRSLSELSESVKKLRAYQWTFAETVTDKPIFESNSDGSCIRVNAAYAKLAERNSPELMGNGWENFVYPEDRPRVFEEWMEAVTRKRVFESNYRVKSRSGKVYSVAAVAIPVTDDEGNITAYIGRFDEVNLVP